ncbi:glycoside hydrolase family 3 C-terminal domain-containing protein [Aristaeella lactis]|uniref:Beta-glucosidase n=1 Tax=Aristaeella lactis TaxID=3046383 RepID=A0AC61PIL8_9FIRM|nr:glycoside hydrolase family 3 N-terminal domain-containing protein [Aristaeella lactis]SMC40133.1 beta-glucosidase [Aristaeella lactis]
MRDRTEAASKAKELVSRMTLEEKASQLKYDAPAIPRLGIPAYNWWNEVLHGVARAGTATVFPQAIGLAAMFDEDLQEKIADVISDEARAKYNGQSSHGDRDIYKGLTVWSPNINIFRDPRWGRGHETYGEDPYLTSRLGIRFIKGLQGSGKYLKTAACSKHFAVHSGPEAVRHQFDARVNAKDMNETYLAAFEATVREAEVESVMGAYNRVNGEPACGSETLLKKTLRDKWGFRGHVVSDCWAIRDFHVNHKVTATAPESAALAIKNGCDLNCGNTYLHILEALQEGLVTEEDITTACERLFTTRFLLGLFADDCEYDSIPVTDNDTDEHAALALEAAEKSMVLLENDGILPLDPQSIKTIAVIGPNADSIPALEGNYNGTSSRYVTFLEGLRDYGRKHGIRVLYSLGCHLFKDRTSGLAQADDRLAEAAMYAEAADVTIACVGLDAGLEGEEGDTGNEYFSGDKKDLLIPESQRRLLDVLEMSARKLITVVTAGSSLNVPGGNAKVFTWYPGQAGGTALAELLFGEKNFSGHLPLTFYQSIDDLPDFEDYSMENRTYRYFTGKPLYPFGHGLSYTTYEVLKADADDLTVSAEIRNTGSMAGDALIQVYAACDSPFAPVHPRLCGFQRVSLNPGETKTVSVTLDPFTRTVINSEGNRISAEHGTLYVGLGQPGFENAGDTVEIRF